MGEHIPFVPKLTHFLPEELGLDLESELDEQLYAESGGVREIALLMLQQRRLETFVVDGDFSREKSDEFMSYLYAEIAELCLRRDTESDARP